MIHWIIVPVVLPAMLAPIIGFVMRHDIFLGAGRLSRWHGASPGRRHGPCRAGRRWHDAYLPAGRLARALWHRAGARQAFGADGASDLEPCADCPDPCHRHRLGRARPAFPRLVPVPADGHLRRVPDRRHLQPLRVLRGAADRILRADDPCGWARPDAGGPAIRGDEPCRFDAVPVRARHALRQHRHAEHRRSGRQCPTSRPTRRRLSGSPRCF